MFVHKIPLSSANMGPMGRQYFSSGQEYTKLCFKREKTKKIYDGHVNSVNGINFLLHLLVVLLIVVKSEFKLQNTEYVLA
jgi:hypothetical protein